MDFDLTGMSKLSLTLIAFAIVLMLVLQVPIGTVNAQGERIEAPEWNEGDEWKYEIKVDVNESVVVTDRVESTDTPVDPNFPNAAEDVEYEETYHLVREKETELHRYYHKDSLGLIFEDGQGSAAFFHPPSHEMKFPVEVGETWNETVTEYVETDSGFDPKQVRLINGTVEGKETKEVEAGTFETYLFNVKIKIKGEGESSIWRVESYYSPEVKNVVQIGVFETRRNPNTGELEERHSGTEELVDYDLADDNGGNNNQNSPSSGLGVVAFVVVSTAVIYSVKSKINKNK